MLQKLLSVRREVLKMEMISRGIILAVQIVPFGRTVIYGALQRPIFRKRACTSIEQLLKVIATFSLTSYRIGLHLVPILYSSVGWILPLGDTSRVWLSPRPPTRGGRVSPLYRASITFYTTIILRRIETNQECTCRHHGYATQHKGSLEFQWGKQVQDCFSSCVTREFSTSPTAAYLPLEFELQISLQSQFSGGRELWIELTYVCNDSSPQDATHASH